MLPKHIKALTGVRGVAAVWVMLCHYANITHKVLHTPDWLNYTFAKGWFAVDLFFILSGFIMVHAHPQGAQNLKEYGHFLRKRLARIYPVHLMTVIFAMLVIGPAGWGYPPSRFEYVRTLLLMHSWWNYSHPIWNSVNWSLSAEWGAYLLFPLLFKLTSLKSRSQVLWSLTLGLAIYVAVSILFANKNMEIVAESALLRSVPCFVFGVLLYRLRQLLPDNARWGTATNLLAVSLPVTLVAISFFSTSNQPVWGVIPLAAFWILALSYNRGRCARWLSSPVMVWLGQISFSIYMVHLLIHYFGMTFISIEQLQASPLWFGAGYIAALWAITLAVAWAMYRFIETPGRQLILNQLNPAQSAFIQP